jgi:predicted nucleic acid-binding protein
MFAPQIRSSHRRACARFTIYRRCARSRGKGAALRCGRRRPFRRHHCRSTSKGRPIQHFDALIAAIARNAGAPLATRDVDGFADCELTIINPWSDDVGPTGATNDRKKPEEGPD